MAGTRAAQPSEPQASVQDPLAGRPPCPPETEKTDAYEAVRYEDTGHSHTLSALACSGPALKEKKQILMDGSEVRIIATFVRSLDHT
jgi:hypothetical protein